MQCPDRLVACRCGAHVEWWQMFDGGTHRHLPGANCWATPGCPKEFGFRELERITEKTRAPSLAHATDHPATQSHRHASVNSTHHCYHSTILLVQTPTSSSCGGPVKAINCPIHHSERIISNHELGQLGRSTSGDDTVESCSLLV